MDLMNPAASSHHTILRMKLFQPAYPRPLANNLLVSLVPFSSSSIFGSWEFRQWMVVEVVDGDAGDSQHNVADKSQC
jgi:hypothetical protein